MSEPEKKSGAGSSSVVLVEQSPASRHKPAYRPTEMQEEPPELHHKRSRAPAVPTAVAEELKDIAHSDSTDRNECEPEMSSEKLKHDTSSKHTYKRGSSSGALALSDVGTKKGSVIPPAQPIPAAESTVPLALSDLDAEKLTLKSKEEDDSINDEITELRTPEVPRKVSEWSDEQEAGGLSRSESRASRVSRAVRQLLCCGTRVESPSEHKISPRSGQGI